MKNLGQFLQEDNDRFSATRLAFLAWAFGSLIIWGTSSFHDGKMQELPTSVQVLIGTLMAGKVVQKFGEKKDPITSETVTIDSTKSSFDTTENGTAKKIVVQR